MRRWLVLFVTVLAMVPAALAGNVAGKWKFAFQTPRGVLEVPVVLKISGEKVTATAGHIQIDGTFTRTTWTSVETFTPSRRATKHPCG